MANEQNTNRGNDFKLERYKYILQQIHSLNENIHKYLTLFQTLTTAIIGGGVAVFVSWQQLNISADVAKITIQGLLGLLVILTLFVIISIVVGILSWFDYRKEEVELLNEAVRSGFRKSPKASNIWRWYETYIVLFIIVIVIVIYLFVQGQIIPLIK